MSIITTKRGKKNHVTSSYFRDISLMRASEIDTNYSARRKEKDTINVEKLQQAYAVQKLMLFHRGCEELSAYVRGLSNAQLETTVTNYPGEYYQEYMDPIDLNDIYKKDDDPNIRPIYKTSGDI